LSQNINQKIELVILIKSEKFPSLMHHKHNSYLGYPFLDSASLLHWRALELCYMTEMIKKKA